MKKNFNSKPFLELAAFQRKRVDFNFPFGILLTMRIKITMEMGGNEFLDFLRKVPKAVAQTILNNTTPVPSPDVSLEQRELFGKSAQELIEAKKR